MKGSDAAAADGRMHIGCGSVVFRRLALREALALIREAGFEYVEVQATAPFCPHVDVERDDPEAFRRLSESLGFRGVTALWSAHGAIIPDRSSVTYVRKSVEWAERAGIPVVHLGDGFRPDGMSEARAFGLLRERLLAILETAEARGVTVAVEPHGTFSLTAGGLERIMGISSSPRLGINYDTANIHRASCVETRGGGFAEKEAGARQDETAVLRRVASRVVHVHVKDVAGRRCTALGEGEVDNRGCIAVLRDAGYRGVLSLETEGREETAEARRLAEVSRRYLVDLLGSSS